MAEPISASPTVEEEPTPSSHPASSAVEPSLREESEPAPADSVRRTGGRKKEVKIKVVMLHGSDVVVECERKIKAAALIERVHTDADCGEKDYFSLFFYHKNQKIFLDPEKTILHQLSRKQRQAQLWELWYGVKFYIPLPSKLKEDYTRHLYAVQICRDIKDNRILIDRETATRLTALMLQASLDDYDPETHTEGYTKKLEEFILIPQETRPENYEYQLSELHKAKAGYTAAQARAEFCDIARRLVRYGFHLFGAQDEHGDVLLIANGYPGIVVYRDKEEIHHFKWHNIAKISYKRKYFRIKYHPLDSEGEANTDTIEMLKLFCGPAPAAKRVWKNAVEQHTFFRLSEPDPPSRLTARFRRGSSFRYSGRTYRQVQSDKCQPDDRRDVPGSLSEPDPQPTRQVFIGKKPDEQKWVVLEEPPVDPQVDKSRYEQQKVQVNFRTEDGVPDTQFQGVIRRTDQGTLEVNTGEEGAGERSYRLSVVDENSQAILTSVSLSVDPEEGAGSHSHGDSTVVFDSSSLPTVKVNADTVTSTTVLESSGREVSTGGVTQSYQHSALSSDEVADGNRSPVDLAVDGSEEACQVQLFVKKEGELLREVLGATEKEEEKEEVTMED